MIWRYTSRARCTVESSTEGTAALTSRRASRLRRRPRCEADSRATWTTVSDGTRCSVISLEPCHRRGCGTAGRTTAPSALTGSHLAHIWVQPSASSVDIPGVSRIPIHKTAMAHELTVYLVLHLTIPSNGSLLSRIQLNVGSSLIEYVIPVSEEGDHLLHVDRSLERSFEW